MNRAFQRQKDLFGFIDDGLRTEPNDVAHRGGSALASASSSAGARSAPRSSADEQAEAIADTDAGWGGGADGRADLVAGERTVGRRLLRAGH